ncbi:MAG TPA: hypothetical protein VGE09_08325 [Pseudoxanthomonas sp.]
MSPAEALSMARNKVAQRAALWEKEADRGGSLDERHMFFAMSRAANIIEYDITRLLEEERGKEPTP